MQDRSQPDVYETSDLPEDDQHLDTQGLVWVLNLFTYIIVLDKYCQFVLFYL